MAIDKTRAKTTTRTTTVKTTNKVINPWWNHERTKHNQHIVNRHKYHRKRCLAVNKTILLVTIIISCTLSFMIQIYYSTYHHHNDKREGITNTHSFWSGGAVSTSRTIEKSHDKTNKKTDHITSIIEPTNGSLTFNDSSIAFAHRDNYTIPNTNISLILSQRQQEWILQQRQSLFDIWYNTSVMDIKTKQRLRLKLHTTIDRFYDNVDVDTVVINSNNSHIKQQHTIHSQGPWLDFLVVGFAKCGTTTIMANLGQIAPMPIKDICELPTITLQRVYKEWPYDPLLGRRKKTKNKLEQEQQLNIDDTDNEIRNEKVVPVQQPFQFTTNSSSSSTTPPFFSSKPFRGSKCPRYIGSSLHSLKLHARSLTKTKFIVGIRHPISWFQSFWRMQGGKDPYARMGICPCPPDETGNRICTVNTNQTYMTALTDPKFDNPILIQPPSLQQRKIKCKTECNDSVLFCLARTRFHVALAQIGKTALTMKERQLLAPNDIDGGHNLVNLNISNQIFLYEQSQLNDDDFWQGLATFVGVSHLPNTHYQDSRGKQILDNNICHPKYDYIRSIIMQYSYQLSRWMVEYFLPLARDPTRSDVVVCNIDKVSHVIATSYQQDPCHRLIPMNDSGTYTLDPTLNETMYIPSTNWIVEQINTKLTKQQRRQRKKKSGSGKKKRKIIK